VTPLKIQDKFGIPLFEGRIYAYALEKCLNILEVYSYVQKTFGIEVYSYAP